MINSDLRERFIILIILWIASFDLAAMAQDDKRGDSDAVGTNTVWDNWYGQVGVDMNLIFPEGHNLKRVFPNGTPSSILVWD